MGLMVQLHALMGHIEQHYLTFFSLFYQRQIPLYFAFFCGATLQKQRK